MHNPGVSKRFAILPRLEAIAVYEGEVTCSNADLIRNHAYCWSRMSVLDISKKTGIEERRYTQLSLEDMALFAAKNALAKSGRLPAEIGAVLVCTCTSTTLIPSIACWLSGELGTSQTHASCDIISACAGMAYGLAEAVRLLQEIDRPLLLVCAEKFSDKIGTVRTSRMIFGDGAAAVVLAPAPEGTTSDITGYLVVHILRRQIQKISGAISVVPVNGDCRIGVAGFATFNDKHVALGTVLSRP